VGSDGAQFIGDDLPTGRAKLAAQLDRGRFSFGANAGVILRKPRTIYDSTIGQQLTWSVGAAARLTDRFSLIGEGYGRAGLPSFALDASPLEVEGGLRIYATADVAIVIGGGAGVVKGIGSPESRFFLSIGYAPDVRDTDGDGIPNGRDKCPLLPEDKDGFQDEDGCPDDDNDGDHNPDATDKCPNEAEDIDGFEDEDGCPDPDNDKDGIPDLLDKCPNDPEDGKPPFPHDGCPVDKPAAAPAAAPAPIDAIVTPAAPAAPAAPSAPEVVAVCPELDSDHDGIPDALDRCPNEPETVNGVDDDDGCPDTGGVEVVRIDGDRLAIDKLPTLAGRKLSRGGEIIVGEMALVMRAHGEVSRWLIAIAMPSAASAKQLGEVIKAQLIAKGLAAERFAIITAAGTPKIGGLVQERPASAATCGPPAPK
jgi:OmpA-OmpF porin, OOP family